MMKKRAERSAAKMRLVETSDGRLVIRSPMAYLWLLLPLLFLVVFLLYPQCR